MRSVIIQWRLTFVALVYLGVAGIALAFPTTLILGELGVLWIPLYVILLIVIDVIRSPGLWALTCADILCPPTFLGWFVASLVTMCVVLSINYLQIRRRRRP
mgnify:FL=1